jgi:hypothetical protein
MGEHLPTEPHVVATVGGLVDEAVVSLTVSGDDLDPDQVTAVLACSPTSAHPRGYRKRESSVPSRVGAWILEERGKPPVGVDDLIEKLLAQLPTDQAIWRDLATRFRVQLRFGIFLEGWNRGFSISGRFLQRLAEMGVSLEFDLYADEPET